MQIDGQDWSWAAPTKNAIVVSMLLALWVVESVAPMFTGRHRRVSHGIANIFLGIINALVGNLAFGTALLGATEWSRETSLGLLHRLPEPIPVWFGCCLE